MVLKRRVVWKARRLRAQFPLALDQGLADGNSLADGRSLEKQKAP
jgi:hypothetical protein